MNQSFDERLEDIRRFYEILESLEKRVGGIRTLANCNGHMDWPERGVYFFFEPGEMRTISGSGLRVVRVGTHGLKEGSQTTLWKRLRQHQGTLKSGGGNHRGSVFRRHVGAAMIARDGWTGPAARDWNISGSAPRTVRDAEIPLERAVSKHINIMAFLWLAIEDVPGPKSQRGVIERNAIALLSNYYSGDWSIDPASENWLGKWAKREEIRRSGLWNVNHISDHYQPHHLGLLQSVVSKM